MELATVHTCLVSLTEGCLHKHPLMKQIRVAKFISQGIGGFVLEVHSQVKGWPERLAMKVIPIGDRLSWNVLTYMCNRWFSRWPILRNVAWAMKKRKRHAEWSTTKEHFVREVTEAQKAGKLGVGPKIFTAVYCNEGLKTMYGNFHVGLIFMELLDSSLEDLFDLDEAYWSAHFASIRQQMVNLSKIADQNGLKHLDLHFENVMVKNQQNPRVYFIDWGHMDAFNAAEDTKPPQLRSAITQLQAINMIHAMWNMLLARGVVETVGKYIQTTNDHYSFS